MRFFSILLIIGITCGSTNAKKRILIGGIFHDDDDLTQKAFHVAVDNINSQYNGFEFVAETYSITRTNSFKAQQIVCNLAKSGVVAIFGPSSVQTSGIVSSMAEKLDIPHFLYHWKSKLLGSKQNINRKMTLNLFPESEALAEVFSNVLIYYKWKSYAIIYEDEDNLVRLKDILQIHLPRSEHPIIIERLDVKNQTFGPLLKLIRQNKINLIVLDINTETILRFLRDAKTVNMMNDKSRYFITNLDAHTLNYSEFISTQANITTLSLVDLKNTELEFVVRAINSRYDDKITNNQLTTEAALVYDAVNFFGQALNKFADNPNELRIFKKDCMEENGDYINDRKLLEFMRGADSDGLTGKVEFNKAKNTSSTTHNKINSKRGSRTEFKIDILEKDKNHFNAIANCDATTGINVKRQEEEYDAKIVEAIGNKTFRIAVRAEPPFVFINEIDAITNKTLEGNDQYTGFVIDLIVHLQRALKFKYIFLKVQDGKNGNLDPKTNEWNGLIGEILKDKADLAVADLTITCDRKKVVDFAHQFMTLGIGILMRKEEPKEIRLFRFLDPFRADVWAYTGLAYIIISTLVFILSRINNDDWESSHPCNQEPEEVESIWNILNCIWLMMGSIMGQGSDILPKGSSTRIVTGLWWFFALIMLASYTANLAAFLTADRLTQKIRNVDDLVKQTKVNYGAMQGGSTWKFFQESNFSLYQRIYAKMETNGDIYNPTSNDEGVARANKVNKKMEATYAFFMESIPMEYQTNKNPNLTQVGDLLDSKGYGIALPLGSEYRKHFSQQILKLHESGELKQMKDKWWKKKQEEEKKEGNQDDLDINDVGGVFLVLIGGCAVAFVVAWIEFFANVKKVAIEEKITHWDALKSELAFTFNFWIVSKPVRSGSTELVSRKSSLQQSMKSPSRFGSESKSLKCRLRRSLSCDSGLRGVTSRSLLNLH